MNIQSAVERLNSQLPLKSRQEQLPASLKVTHLHILYTLVKEGRVPDRHELQEILGEENLEMGLQRLRQDDLIVLDADNKWPVGAYPVTLESTPHILSISGHSIHAMCAIDAVSVAPMFDAEVRIASRCHQSQTPIIIHMHGSNVKKVEPTSDVKVGVRWQMPSAVAAHSMCMEMVFFKDNASAVEWQGGDSDNISLFTLPEAVEFGMGFFLPLLD